MIPYIIINGVSSRTITGLIIQTLPPIAKPKVRTTIEEVDGRDGDIVTTLGFSAYDKTFTIGLAGDYDVDDVIKYFDAKGTVIFSNEPNKYYNFAIYEQIDFDKLIRFKTATVTMHVQPFKYLADEGVITWTNTNNALYYNADIRNSGNIYSKPTLTITGSGTITVYLGLTQILEIALSGTTETIIIYVENLNAYDPSGNYLNRQVTGNYSNLIFSVGVNNLRVVGTLTIVSIDKYSRFI